MSLPPPTVSIIVPTQGQRSSLTLALRSALAQGFLSFELLIIDDASGGAGWRQRPDLAPLLGDTRIRIVPFHQSRGCAAAKNAGLHAARGEWVCYLDDDNEYCPNKVAAQHALALSTGSPVVLCGLEVRVRGRQRFRQVNRRDFEEDALLLDAVADTNVLFHRRDAGIDWNESLGTVDDACFFQALVARYSLNSVPNVPQPLVIYHAHGGARANRDFGRFYRGQRCLMARWARRFSPSARRVLLLRSLVAFAKFRRGGWSQLFRYGGRLMREGGWREWRVVANAIGVKLPLVRRWMVT